MANDIEFIDALVPANPNTLENKLTISPENGLIELISNDEFYQDVSEKVRDVYDEYLKECRDMGFEQRKLKAQKIEDFCLKILGYNFGIAVSYVTVVFGFLNENGFTHINDSYALLAPISLLATVTIGTITSIFSKYCLLSKTERDNQHNSLNEKYAARLLGAYNDCKS